VAATIRHYRRGDVRTPAGVNVDEFRCRPADRSARPDTDPQCRRRALWGFSIQYSTYYLTSRFTPGKLPKDEPLHQFVPLVEFAFETPRGEKTAATMNPGLAYAADTWQVAAEAIIPLNSEGGRTIGVRAHLFLFLDDLMPAVFGKPLLSQ
jgi:hypothetical protein